MPHLEIPLLGYLIVALRWWGEGIATLLACLFSFLGFTNPLRHISCFNISFSLTWCLPVLPPEGASLLFRAAAGECGRQGAEICRSWI